MRYYRHIHELMKGFFLAPSVSIVMPLYNGQAFLQDCLRSLLEQSFQDFELIVVDDGSTDSSLQIAEEFGRLFKHFHIIKQCRCYAGKARNRGADLAVGEYVLFLDSDDVFQDSLLEKVVSRMNDTNADACVFGGKPFNEAPGDLVDSPGYLNPSFLPNSETFSFLDVPDNFFQITNPAPWTKAFRLSFLRKTGLRFQHHENANDFFFSYAALAAASSICAVREDLVWYRVRGGSTQHRRKKQPLAFLNALVCIKALLIRNGTYDLLESSYLKLAIRNYRYNLIIAKEVEDTNAFDLLSQTYKDYAAFELGLIRRPSEIARIVGSNYMGMLNQLELLCDNSK